MVAIIINGIANSQNNKWSQACVKVCIIVTQNIGNTVETNSCHHNSWIIKK